MPRFIVPLFLGFATAGATSAGAQEFKTDAHERRLSAASFSPAVSSFPNSADARWFSQQIPVPSFDTGGGSRFADHMLLELDLESMQAWAVFHNPSPIGTQGVYSITGNVVVAYGPQPTTTAVGWTDGAYSGWTSFAPGEQRSQTFSAFNIHRKLVLPPWLADLPNQTLTINLEVIAGGTSWPGTAAPQILGFGVLDLRAAARLTYIYDGAPCSWSDLDGTSVLPGATSVLIGSGSGVPGGSVDLLLKAAPMNAPAALVISAVPAGVPLFGGVLIPDFGHALVIPGFADAAGSLAFSFVVPPSMDDGSSLFMQCWVLNPIAIGGLASSNGLELLVTSD